MARAKHYTDMSDKDYFANPALDQSQLKAFLRNPADWGWARLHADSKEPTEAMKFGTAFHAYIMGTQNVVAPEEGATFRSKAMQQWKAEQIEAGNLVVSYDQMQLLERMRDNFQTEAPELWEITQNGYRENAIFWKDRRTGLEFKAKPDLIPSGADYLVDFKTAQSASAKDFHREVVNFGYHIQALFYRQAVALCAPELFDRTSRVPKAMQFWVFEKTGACDWQPFVISGDNPIMDSAKDAINNAKIGIAEMIEKADNEGLGRTVDAAAQYAILHGYCKKTKEVEFTAYDLLSAEEMIVFN